MRSSTRQSLLKGAGLLALALCGRGWLRALGRYELQGRVVLITGGSRGLGLETARVLAAQGAHVALCARDPAELDRALEQLDWSRGDVAAYVCDVTDAEAVREMIGEIEQDFGRLDVVINNAGIIQVGPMETMTREDYEQALQTHLFGPLNVIEAALPLLRRQGDGRIVNISSIGGLISVPHLLPYSASKFAFVGYSLGLRAELAKDGISVTAVCPGTMRTGSPRNAMFKGRHRAEYAWFKLADSLPIASVGSRRAAAQVVDALCHGDALAVLGVPFQIAATLYALFPGLGADLLGWVNRLLPEAGGIGSRQLRGADSETWLSESWLTTLTDNAAERNNELPPADVPVPEIRPARG